MRICISLGRGVLTAIATVGIIGVARIAPAAILVAPNANASVEGNTNNAFPFQTNSGSAIRYQQVYASSQFSAFGGPQSISQIAFRNDGPTGQGYSHTFPSVEVHLSTTSVAPDALSTTFASNVGANDAIVYNAALTLTSSNTGTPKNFDYVINLSTPFIYNPSGGNLLFDLRLTSSDFFGGTAFDVETTTGDSVSRVLSTNGSLTTADSISTAGLVTRFTFTPEPASLALIGLAGMGVLRRQRAG